MATLKAKADVCSLPTTNGGTTARSGYGFQPGLIFNHAAKFTGLTAQLGAGLFFGTGISVGTSAPTKMAGYSGAVDATVTASVTNAMTDAHAAEFIAEANPDTEDGYADLTHGADGLTWTGAADPPNAAYVARMLAIDSAAIASSKLYTITSPTATGNDVHTDVGFQGDLFVFWCHGLLGTALPRVDDLVSADTQNPPGWMFGVATGTAAGAQWVLNAGFNDEANNLANNGGRYFLKSNCIANVDWDHNAGGTNLPNELLRASLTAISSTGYTLNWAKVDVAGYLISVLAIKFNTGYFADAHVIATPTATGNFSKTGMSFKPSALLTMSGCRVADTAGTITRNNLVANYGITDGTNTYSCGAFYQDTGTNVATQAKTYLDVTNIHQYRATNTSTATEAVAFVSFNSDGYTWNSTTAPASSSDVGVLAFGPGASGGPTVAEMMAAISTTAQADNTPQRMTRWVTHGQKGPHK